MTMMFQFRKQKRWKQKQLLFPACPGQEASSRVELQAGIMVSSHQAQGHKLRATDLPVHTSRFLLRWSGPTPHSSPPPVWSPVRAVSRGRISGDRTRTLNNSDSLGDRINSNRMKLNTENARSWAWAPECMACLQDGDAVDSECHGLHRAWE